jgi:hypothetical protein
MKKMVLFAALCIMIMASGYAQEPSDVEAKFNELIQKYDKVKGVECMTLVKGRGLGMVKMMLNKQLGKDFMKGVRSITIIDYGDASEEISQSVRNELNIFTTLLEEFHIGNEKEFKENEYIRSFASASDDNTISDFVIAIEDGKNKMFMYMAGDIKVE